MIDLKKAEKEDIEVCLLEMADNMASAATDMKGHNYFQFLEARKCLVDHIHELVRVHVNK